MKSDPSTFSDEKKTFLLNVARECVNTDGDLDFSKLIFVWFEGEPEKHYGIESQDTGLSPKQMKRWHKKWEKVVGQIRIDTLSLLESLKPGENQKE